MKRISSFLLAVCLIFPIVGCSSEETTPAPSGGEAESSEAAAPAGSEAKEEGSAVKEEGAE